VQSQSSKPFHGVPFSKLAFPQLPAAFEAAAVVAAVMGFGLGWAWLAGPAERDGTVYPVSAMSTPESAGSAPETAAMQAEGEPLHEVEEWLIDGFNLLHAALLGGEDRSRWWTAASRSRVLEAVAGATHEREHHRVWVVFDGSRPAPRSDAGRLHSVFAPSADDWLVRRVKQAPEPGHVVVVTADRKLANRARHHGARVLTPGSFLARAAGPSA